ncbi:PA2817 family protein [Marinomonas epiphytica]
MNLRTQYIYDAFMELKRRSQEHFPFDQVPLAEEEQDFVSKWDQTLELIESNSPDYTFAAQELLARYIRCYANLVPLVKRELLWLIGGECLHFLGDEEINLYQALEDQLYELEQKGESYDIEQQISQLRSDHSPLH